MKPKILVSFSGGKDSQACLILTVKKYGAENVEAVFCDTGWEHPDTYYHINEVCKQLSVGLIILKSKYDFVSLAKHKKRFPSTKARFCTVELKIKPMIDYILSLKNSCIIIQGIRAKESKARSEMNIECNFFKEYFEGKYSYRKNEVFEWCKNYDASVFRPIFEFTSQQVIDYILENGQQPNPLYKKGFSRVGCFPCIMSRQSEVKLISNDNWAKERLFNAEKEVGRNFFAPNYIPQRFCKNRIYPTAIEVFNYVNRNNVGMTDMFYDEEISCMSMYHGLCE